MKSGEKLYIIDVSTIPDGLEIDKFGKLWESINEDQIDEVFPGLVYSIVTKEDLEGINDEDKGPEE